MKSNENSKILSPRLIPHERAAQEALGGSPEARREACIRAAILVLVTRGYGHHRSAREVNEHLIPEWKCHNDFALWRVTGGYAELCRRMTQGGVIPEGVLGVWSPDFWHGLKASGGIRRYGSEWIVAGGRPALEEALTGSLPFHCVVKRNGKGLVMSSLQVARLGADNPEGIQVLAGLLAGGWRCEREGRSWIAVSNRPGNVALLKSYGIPHVRSKWFGNYIMISPFWGALLGGYMPRPLMEWYEGWRGKKGMCPLLPWGFVRLAYGRVCEKFPLRIVPFLVHRHGLVDACKIPIGDVRERVAMEYGFFRVDPRIRRAWLERMVRLGVRKEEFDTKIPLDFIEGL